MLGSEWWLDNAYRLKALDVRFFAAFKESENLMIQKTEKSSQDGKMPCSTATFRSDSVSISLVYSVLWLRNLIQLDV